MRRRRRNRRRKEQEYDATPTNSDDFSTNKNRKKKKNTWWCGGNKLNIFGLVECGVYIIVLIRLEVEGHNGLSAVTLRWLSHASSIVLTAFSTGRSSSVRLPGLNTRQRLFTFPPSTSRLLELHRNSLETTLKNEQLNTSKRVVKVYYWPFFSLSVSLCL